MQSAEKVIRAILTSEGKHAGIKHRLDEMVDLVPEENPLKQALREVEELSAYDSLSLSDVIRQNPGTPARRELDAFIKKVNAALSETALRLGVDLDKSGKPAARPGPIR